MGPLDGKTGVEKEKMKKNTGEEVEHSGGGGGEITSSCWN